MANDLDAYKDLMSAKKRKDKKGYRKIISEIQKGKYGNEAKGLVVEMYERRIK